MLVLLQEQLDVKITGVIVHGRAHYHFLYTNAYPHDANQNLSAITQVLAHQQVWHEEHAPKKALPRRLEVQMDNASGENKNRFTLAYCYNLVHSGTFDRVLS
jgi:hypothetical protein